MLSRRSIRVKVMQVLFALGRDEKLTLKEALKNYSENIDSCFQLFLFNLYAIVEVTKISVEDSKNRKSKHLPTKEDSEFTPKFYENQIIQGLVNNVALNKEFKKGNFDAFIDADFYKKLYTNFAKNEKYSKYVFSENTPEQDREILLELYRFCRQDEYFNEVMEDNFLCWIDDKSLVIGAVKKVIKAYPGAEDSFYKQFVPEEEAVEEFGQVLLSKSHKEDEELLTTIKPVLKNWDHERLAIIDMILLKMALIEMKDFTSIPTKVTLNEYVEVAKKYSTAKSKDFVNGILDKLLKDLEENGQIKKTGRGLDS